MNQIQSANDMLAVVKRAVKQSTSILKKYQDTDETVCRLRIIRFDEGTFTVVNEDEDPQVPYSMRYDELNLLTDRFFIEAELNPFTGNSLRMEPPTLASGVRTEFGRDLSTEPRHGIMREAEDDTKKGNQLDTKV